MFNETINEDDHWIDIWSAFPYSSYADLYNRFYVNNASYLYEKPLVPKMTDLDGMQVTGAFIHYPPYTAYYVVVGFILCS